MCPRYIKVLIAYDFVLSCFSVWSSRECDCQCRRTVLCIIGRKAVVTDGANRDGVYTGRVAIAVAVVVCETSISSRPHIDVTFTATTLENETG